MMSEDEFRKSIDYMSEKTSSQTEMLKKMLSTLYLLGSYVSSDAVRSEMQENKENKEKKR